MGAEQRKRAFKAKTFRALWLCSGTRSAGGTARAPPGGTVYAPLQR